MAELADAFRAFRSSLWRWSDRQPGSRFPEHAGLLQAARRSRGLPVRWVLAAAAVAVLAVIPIYRHTPEAPSAGDPDALLLEQVNTQMSRTVPASLEPLMELMVENSNATKDGETR